METISDKSSTSSLYLSFDIGLFVRFSLTIVILLCLWICYSIILIRHDPSIKLFSKLIVIDEKLADYSN